MLVKCKGKTSVLIYGVSIKAHFKRIAVLLLHVIALIDCTLRFSLYLLRHTSGTYHGRSTLVQGEREAYTPTMVCRRRERVVSNQLSH